MTAGLETGTVREPSTAPRRRTTFPLVLLYISGALFVLALVSQITGADDIASSGTLSAALVLAVPIGLAGLGGLWSERAGIVNIGLEGMMILGTWGAGFGGYQWGPWAGVALGVFCGALGGLLHAVATVTFGVDHIISGVAINILGLGTAQYLASVAFVGQAGWGHDAVTADPRPPGAVHSWSLEVPGRHREQRLVLRVRGGRAPSRGHGRRLVPHGDLGRAARGDLLHPVAHGVRPAAAVLRREPGGGRVARRERLQVQVLRGHSRPGRSPGSVAPSSPSSLPAPTGTGKPAGAGTSAWPR
jgi:hypothetical protein